MPKDSLNSNFINKIVKHYLKYDKDNPFIFISALLAFFGISLGVMVLIISMGIINGSEEEFKKRLLIMNYPITASAIKLNIIDKKMILELKKNFPKLSFSPYNIHQIIVKSYSGINGAVLYAVDFELESKVNSIFKEATKELLPSKSKFNIIVGETLLEHLNISKEEKIDLYFSKETSIGFNSMPVTYKRFNIIGLFNSGLKDYDKSIIYTTFQAFNRILKIDNNFYNGIHIYSDNPEKDIKELKAFIKNKNIEGLYFEGWWEQNINFFAAMEVEKKALFLVLMLIILVATLNIISSMLMTIMSRRSEIALMLTLGATKREIKAIFFRLGIIIGIAGIFVGAILGYFGIWIINKFSIISLNEDVYGFSKLTASISIIDVVSILSGAFIIVLIFSYYPANKSSKIDPVSILRNE